MTSQKKKYFMIYFDIMIIKIFQNCPFIYQIHHIALHLKNNHSIKHFNKYVEFIVI
jgi:hypothetical protein